jgi:hypothetical protein
MTPLRCFLISMVPLFALATCKDDETSDKPNGNGGTDSMAGEGGRDDGGSDSGGSAGTSRGGTSGRGGASTGGASGEAGEAGTGGEPDGGESGRGGAAGSGARGGNAGGGMGGNAGNAGGGAGGSGGMTCMTVTIPLVNGDFDDGASGWTQYDDEAGAVRPIIVAATSAGVTAESEPNVAHLGGVNDAAAGMFQAIAIPEGTVSMTLTGFRRATTQEASSAPIDVLTIQLYEDAETATGLVGDFVVVSNEDATGDWVEFTGTVDVEAHGGHMLELDVYAETDGSLITEFFVDSLGGAVVVCR